MKAFDNTEFKATRKQYEEEVKEKWGKTDAYAEYAGKTKGYSKEKQNELIEGMEDILEEFALCIRSGKEPDSTEAQGLVKKLQDYITENYYACTKQILAGLGKMYIVDDRFEKNINKHAEGNAEFISEAIDIYCK